MTACDPTRRLPIGALTVWRLHSVGGVALFYLLIAACWWKWGDIAWMPVVVGVAAGLALGLTAVEMLLILPRCLASYRFDVADEAIRIHQGVLISRRLTIPSDQVLYIEVKQDPISMALRAGHGANRHPWVHPSSWGRSRWRRHPRSPNDSLIDWLELRRYSPVLLVLRAWESLRVYVPIMLFREQIEAGLTFFKWFWIPFLVCYSISILPTIFFDWLTVRYSISEDALVYRSGWPSSSTTSARWSQIGAVHVEQDLAHKALGKYRARLTLGAHDRPEIVLDAIDASTLARLRSLHERGSSRPDDDKAIPDAAEPEPRDISAPEPRTAANGCCIERDCQTICRSRSGTGSSS